MKRAALAAASLLAAALLVEVLGHAAFRFPRLSASLPEPLYAALRAHWMDWGIPVPIQLRTDCARPDDELFYTLKPGECVFASPEFSDAYRINRLGVRDDAVSLDRPEIVVLGDSHAMGWGVGQDEAFPQVLERATRRKVLNLGVSSYGTWRETRMLARADRSAMKVLVIQHCPNDAIENAVRARGLPRPPTPSWESLAAEMAARPSGFGAVWAGLLGLGRPAVDPAGPPAGDPLEDFLILLAGVPEMKDPRLKVVVFSLGSNPNHPHTVQYRLAARLKGGAALPPALRDAAVVDVRALHDDRSLWNRLDPHLNADGHAELARLVREAAGL